MTIESLPWRVDLLMLALRESDEIRAGQLAAEFREALAAEAAAAGISPHDLALALIQAATAALRGAGRAAGDERRELIALASALLSAVGRGGATG
jgi:hypothetical protein